MASISLQTRIDDDGHLTVLGELNCGEGDVWQFYKHFRSRELADQQLLEDQLQGPMWEFTRRIVIDLMNRYSAAEVK